ncbi:hypothetical protein GCM10010515_05720 [Streptomyces fructofermentans]|uniref:Response regulatory domain-containing protein n=1 Tax=Streptomyces fructofermentans TaxID=152141 RepID=A0A918N5G5_9ACTN|nr:hypothetical protein GCM10010515_05720 [Streptomyces fructofermentans]
MDDNKVIRQLIRVNLELEGLEVVTAADGVECLDVIHQVRPDVVTLDVVMPRLDGLRTAARLRADPRTRHLPVAIVSACTQYEVESGLDVGVDAFLAKPFEPVELVRLVRQLIERARGDGVPRGGVPAAPGVPAVPAVPVLGAAGSHSAGASHPAGASHSAHSAHSSGGSGSAIPGSGSGSPASAADSSAPGSASGASSTSSTSGTAGSVTATEPGPSYENAEHAGS